DQQPLTVSEDGGVRGVPGHGEFRSDDGHGVVIDDEGTQRPVEAGSRDLRSWWRRSCGVLTPDAATLDAFVTAEANVKRGWSVAERFVGQLADDGVANDPVAAAPSAPVISSVWLAFQDGLLPGDVLAGAGQIEGVESAECRKVRGRESRLGHVEVFRMDCVRTSIIGRPRRLSAQRRAVSWNHRSTLSFAKSPERADGVNVAQAFFDGRIASELRLWDALDADLLVPFHYYGIADNVDLRGVTFRAGGYDSAELSEIYTGNDDRAALIVEQVGEKILDPQAMRALGFCVSVDHAHYMAEVFTRAGIESVALSGQSTTDNRDAALRRLRTGEVQCIFTVDLFNEGVDVPEVDTVLM